MNTVQMDVQGHIACIRMNRPEKLNAIDDEMLAELFAAFQRVREDDAIWVAILTGNGRAFSPGHDLVTGSFKGDKVTPGQLYLSLSQTWKPVIAAVNGDCLAQGAGLALLSDIRLAADMARFGWPQVRRGFTSGSGPNLLVHYIPLGAALKILFTGELIGAAEAYRLGLVQEVLPLERLLDRAVELATTICGNAPLAVRATKEKAIRGLAVPDFAERWKATGVVAPNLLQSEDAQEGLRAFAEKRRPVFKGR